jgi:fatty-acyl-CoA synthase
MTELAPGTTCMALILEAAAAHAESDAIVLPGDRVSYHGFVAGAKEWARAFIALGVSKGEHVGVLLPNGTQFMHVLFGAMRLRKDWVCRARSDQSSMAW